MIPAAAITEWSRQVPWPSVDQVEQDLLLSRLIVEIANDDYLGNELIFRGGTCLHKLVAPTPLRYSEDLDYVRTTSGGIREFTRAVTSIGDRLGMQVTTKIGKHPKIYLRAPFEAGSTSMKVKIEVNTFERSPARPLERTPYGITTSWFAGEAAVQTFAVEELVTTKIRALFQRSKGPDLFDLWMAVTHLDVRPDDLVAAFAPYRPDGFTGRRAEVNLRAKVAKASFVNDLRPLVATWPENYEIGPAAELVIDEVLSLID